MIVLPEATIEVKKQFYKINGERYQRVSTATGVINKPALVPWAKKQVTQATREALLHEDTREGIREVLELGFDLYDNYADYEGFVDRLLDSVGRAPEAARDKAADAGTNAHNGIMDMLLTGRGPLTEHEGQVEGYLYDEDLYGEAVELTVWSDMYKIAGTIDWVGRTHDGRQVILDWKTGSGPWPEMQLQLGGYAWLLSSMGYPVHEARIVKVSATSAEDYTVPDLAQAGRAFRRAMNLQRDVRNVRWA